MKKYLSIIIIGIIIISISVTNANNIDDIKQEVFNISFSSLIINEQENFSVIALNGTNSINFNNYLYEIPTYKKTFIFPFGTEIYDVNIDLKNIQEITLKKEIKKTSLEYSLDSQYQKPLDLGIKEENFTESWLNYDTGVGINGNERCLFLNIEVFPIQYNNLKQNIRWTENADIIINYKKSEISDIPFYDNFLLIICPEKFSDELSDLAIHKNNRGFITKIVTLDDIYNGNYFPVVGRDNVEKIKYFIKNAVENWYTSNVLIVGSSSEFPARETHVNVWDYDHEIFVSDLYYADIYDEDYNFCSWDSNNNDIFGEFKWGESEASDDLDLDKDPNNLKLQMIWIFIQISILVDLLAVMKTRLE